MIDHLTTQSYVLCPDKFVFSVDRVSGWMRSRRVRICWLPPPFIQPSHLTPTMNLLLHYPFGCQDGAPQPICYSSFSHKLKWETGMCLCFSAISTDKQTGRILWSGLGDSSWFVCFFDTGCLRGGNAESIKTHLPQNKINTRGEQTLDGSG